MEHHRFHNQKETLIAEKLKTQGILGTTAEDHKDINSGFDKILSDIFLKNPGKTLGEAMTNEEIISWIQKEKEALTEYFRDLYNPNDKFSKGHIFQNVSIFKASLNYLKTIGRLPKEFEDFDPESFLPNKSN